MSNDFIAGVGQAATAPRHAAAQLVLTVPASAAADSAYVAESEFLCHGWRRIGFWIYIYIYILLVVKLKLCPFFPTCQVRVVRFYQSCSPHPPPPPPPLPPPVSPRPCLHPLPCPLPPCQLFDNLFANFCAQWALLELNCRLPIWVGTAGPQPGTFRAQWAPLDLNLGPSKLSGHRWTSTWNLQSSVGTAGPQPGTFRAQWAPLDLNLRPSELSGHRWTSTWDLQSSVGTAGPQPGTLRAQWATEC